MAVDMFPGVKTGSVVAVVFVAILLTAAAQPSRPVVFGSTPITVAGNGNAAPAEAPQLIDEAALLSHAERATVRVSLVISYNNDFAYLGGGSGVMVAPGHVLTNYHVIETVISAASYLPVGASIIVVVTPHKDVAAQGAVATIANTWQDADLALLRTTLNTPVMPLTQMVPGKTVHTRAIGYPGITDQLRGLSADQIISPSEPFVSDGAVALVSEAPNYQGGPVLSMLFHTAPINPGNSGGPLVDACGRLIGINTAGAAVQMNSNGISAPQGQFIAMGPSTIQSFLVQSGVGSAFQTTVCDPEANRREVEAYAEAQRQRIEGERLKAEEDRIAAEQRAKEAEQKQWLFAGLGVFLAACAGGGVFLLMRKRTAASKTSQAPVDTPPDVATDTETTPVEDASVEPPSPGDTGQEGDSAPPRSARPD